MNTKISAVIYTLALTLSFLISLFPVSAIPQQPHQFYGTVTVAGEPAINGILIEAAINNVTYLSTTTQDGKYGYSPLFLVPADDPDTSATEGGKSGDTIDFYVAKTYAASYTFKYGEITQLNLSIALETPYADFKATPRNGAEPLTTQFTDQSRYFDSINSWTWNFGDGNITTTTLATIIHMYIQNGTYTVTLTVNGTKNAATVIDSETKTDYIIVEPALPTITITSPTTQNPVYSKPSQSIAVSFTYSAATPKNATAKVYHLTTIIGAATITSLQAGTDIERSVNVTLSASASDGKYDVDAKIYTYGDGSWTNTKTEAVVLDTTPPTIQNIVQTPTGGSVFPTDIVKVNATVIDQLSGLKNVTLAYSIDDGETWTTIQMEKLTEQIYNATIPEFPYSTIVKYYIQAVDKAENTVTTQTMPCTYPVIPELPNAAALVVMMLAVIALVTAMLKGKGRKPPR